MKRFLATRLLAVLAVTTAVFGLTSCLGSNESMSESGESEIGSESGESTSEPEEVVSYELEVTGGKRSYYVGDGFASQGLTVTLKGGETDEVLTAEEYELDFSAYKADEAGEYVITVTYKADEKVTATYTVTVNELPDARQEDKWSKDLWL